MPTEITIYLIGAQKISELRYTRERPERKYGFSQVNLLKNTTQLTRAAFRRPFAMKLRKVMADFLE